jgi:hypothetical protein
VFLEHLHEARFANARFAAEEHYLSEAVLDLRPALQQQPHFLFPAHERSQAGAASRVQATAGRALIQHLIDLQWLGEALEEWSAERLAGKEAAKQLQGRGTDHQGIGRCEPLQAGGEVGGLAERQLFLPGTSPHLTHDHQPGMDPQAYGQVHAPLLRQARIELAQGLHDPQPGPPGPLGVILMRQGVAEVDEQAIAEILGDMPLKAGNHLGAGLLIGPHHLP